MEQKNKINEKKQNLQTLKNIEDEEDEDEPKWANDNIEEYNNIKIEFKAIPNNKSNNIYDNYKKNNIDVDKFFQSNSNDNINNIENSDLPKNNNDIQEIKEDFG